MARYVNSQRAMSLLELAIVLSIIGLLGVGAISRYGHSALGNGGAAGFARKLALSLQYARRSTISTGDNHFLQLHSSGGSITGYSLIRRTGSGDIQVDATRTVPQDVTVNSGSSVLEYDFEGSALSSYTITVSGPNRTWNVSVVMLTGAVQVNEVP